MAGRTITCPSCGATNAGDAQWCTQCYAQFEPAGDSSGVAAVDADAAQQTMEDAAAAAAADAAQRRLTEESSWTCRYCGARNRVETSVCRVCYRSIYDTFEEKPEGSAVEPEEAQWWGAFFPGLGLVRVGWVMSGLVIAIVAVFAIGSGVFLTVAGRPVWGVLLALEGIGIWIVAVRDAMVVASQRPSQVLLRPQVLTVLALLAVIVAGITFASILGEAREAV